MGLGGIQRVQTTAQSQLPGKYGTLENRVTYTDPVHLVLSSGNA